RGIIENSDTRPLSYILETAVATIPIQAIGETGRLTNVEAIGAVFVYIPDSNAVVAINVDVARAIQQRPPVVDPRKQLFLVRAAVPESGASHLHEDWSSRATFCFLERLPPADAP